jgi:molecular chaperone GrpE
MNKNILRPFGAKPHEGTAADNVAPVQAETGAEHADARAHREQARAREAYASHDPHVGGDLPPFHPESAGYPGGMFPGGEGTFQTFAEQPGGEGAEETAILPENLAALCRDNICTACSVKKEADDARLRALAEVDNARKRMEREKDEHVRYAAEKVLTDILPALDNLDLALQHAAPDKACRNFVMGVEMTRKLMTDSLRKHGLEAVGEVGEEFDPNLHEAVGMADNPTIPDGRICGLLAHGYRLRDRLLRPARVMVCKRG